MRPVPPWKQVECPTCGAGPGARCRTIHGHAREPHNPRLREASFAPARAPDRART